MHRNRPLRIGLIRICATCDGPFYKGQRVAVISGGNSAAQDSIFLTRFVEHVTLLVRGEALTASQILQEKVLGADRIDVRTHSEAVAFRGEESMLKAVVKDNRLYLTAILMGTGFIHLSRKG